MDPLTILRLIVMFVIGFGLWTLLVVGWLRLRAWWWRWLSPAPLPEPEPAPTLVAVGAVVGDQVFVSVPPGPVVPLPASVWRPDVAAWETTLDGLKSVRRALEEGRGVGLMLVRVPEDAPVSGSWAEGMFDSLPVELHEPVRRALSKVLHPDAGGDPVSFRAVNEASPRVRL